MQPKPPRPTGVTILGVLAILGGIFGLLGGGLLIGLGALIGTLAASADISNAIAVSGYPGLSALDVSQVGVIIMILGAVILLLGIMTLAVGIGFFGGKGWAWTLGIIVSVINVVLSIVQIAFGSYGSIIGLIIGGLILYYLMRPHVKTFFGKGQAAAPMPTSTPAP